MDNAEYMFRNLHVPPIPASYTEELIIGNIVSEQTAKTYQKPRPHDRFGPIMFRINMAPLSRRLALSQRWITFKGRTDVSFPIESFRPLVQYPYVTKPKQIPRNVAVERLRRQYRSLRVDVLLHEAKIQSWEILPRQALRKAITNYDTEDKLVTNIPIFPLEWFDDFEYDPMSPNDFLNLGVVNGVKHPTPGVAFIKNPSILKRTVSAKFVNEIQNMYHWQKVIVEDYEPITRRWTVMDYTTGDRYRIPRIYLRFMAEDPVRFVERIKTALKSRDKAMRELRFNVIVDCMILTGVPEPNQKAMDKIFEWVISRKELKRPELIYFVERLEASVKTDYRRTMGKMEMLHTLSTGANDYSFIKLPDPEERYKSKPIDFGDSMKDYNYKKQRTYLAFILIYCTKEVIVAIDKVHCECMKVSQMLLFTTALSKTITLDEFIAVQDHTTSTIMTYLKGTWIETTAVLVCMPLRGLTKSWFNINITKWSIYECSKLYRMIQLIKYMMQNALRNLLVNSMNAYKKLLCTPCECLLHVNESFKWGPNLLESPFTQTVPHVFSVLLKINDTEAYYSTDPESFLPNILKLFDEAIRQSHFIHIIDPMVLTNLVFAHDLYLSSIGLIDPIVIKIRERLKLCYSKALIPLLAYADKYNQHVSLFNLDIRTYITNFEALNKSPQEIQHEITFHYRMKEILEDTIPPNIQIGPFYINVLPLKTHLVNKREELAKRVIDFLTEKLKNETSELVDEYTEIIKRLTEKPISIEQIFATKDWMQSVPDIVQEHESEMKRKLFEYDILDNFFHPLPFEDFMIKWQALASPLKCMTSIQEAKITLEEDAERFLKQQVSDLTMYDEKVESLNMLVTQFSLQYDTSKATEFSIEIKKAWKAITDTEALGELLNKRQVLFEIPEIDLSPIQMLQDSFLPYKTLWVTAADFLKWEEAWRGNPLANIDMENIRTTLDALITDIQDCIETFKELPLIQNVAQFFYDRIMDFERIYDVMDAVKNPDWAVIHWQEFCKQTGAEIKLSNTMNFNYCISKGIMEFADLAIEISKEATRTKDEYEAALIAEEERKIREEAELLAKKKARKGRKLP